MAALICIKRVRGTFCQLVNIANRFLRIFSNMEASIRFIFPGGAGYPYLPTRLNDKSRIIKNTPPKKKILNFFWGVYMVAIVSTMLLSPPPPPHTGDEVSRHLLWRCNCIVLTRNVHMSWGTLFQIWGPICKIICVDANVRLFYLCNVNVNLSRVYLYFGLAGIRIRVENSRAPSTSGWFHAPCGYTTI